MSLIKLLKKSVSSLSFQGVKPKTFNGQVSQLKKEFAKDSTLDLNGETPEKYVENQPL